MGEKRAQANKDLAEKLKAINSLVQEAKKLNNKVKLDILTKGLKITKYHKSKKGKSADRLLRLEGKKLVWTHGYNPKKGSVHSVDLVSLTIERDGGKLKLIHSGKDKPILTFGTYMTSIADVETALNDLKEWAESPETAMFK